MIAQWSMPTPEGVRFLVSEAGRLEAIAADTSSWGWEPRWQSIRAIAQVAYEQELPEPDLANVRPGSTPVELVWWINEGTTGSVLPVSYTTANPFNLGTLDEFESMLLMASVLIRYGVHGDPSRNDPHNRCRHCGDPRGHEGKACPVAIV